MVDMHTVDKEVVLDNGETMRIYMWSKGVYKMSYDMPFKGGFDDPMTCYFTVYTIGGFSVDFHPAIYSVKYIHHITTTLLLNKERIIKATEEIERGE